MGYIAFVPYMAEGSIWLQMRRTRDPHLRAPGTPGVLPSGPLLVGLACVFRIFCGIYECGSRVFLLKASAILRIGPLSVALDFARVSVRISQMGFRCPKIAISAKLIEVIFNKMSHQWARS